MRTKGRIWRWIPAAIALAVIGAGPSARECDASTTKSLAVGAITCAAEMFQHETSRERAKKLLRFGIACDPDNTRGLLMQARMERNRDPVAEPPAESVRKPFLKNVLRLAERTASLPHKLLLYRVAELLDPENEIALVALTKARNDGRETDFSRLLDQVVGKAEEPVESLPPTPGDGDSEETSNDNPHTATTTGGSSKTCRDLVNEANPLKNLRRKRDADAISRDLGDLRIGAFPPEGTSIYSLDWLNFLNQQLIRRGYVVIPYCNETFSLSAVEFTDAGIPKFSGSLRKSSTMRGRGQRSRKLGHFLAEACTGMGTGYRIVDGAILLTAPEHADNQACTSVRKAGDIVKEFAENHLQARKKYRNKYLVVEGRLSETGHGVSGDKVMLDEGRMELNLDRTTDTELDELNVGGTVQAVGRFSHNNLGRVTIKECILISPTQL